MTLARTASPQRARITAWAAWDWGSAAFNAVITTFVFTVYLTSGLFLDPSLRVGTAAYDAAKASLSTGLGLGLSVAGLVVALVAPVLGARTDFSGHRRRWLGINTAVVVLAMVAMFGVVGSPAYFPLGVVLVGVGTIFYEFATVNYNAMLPGISTPRTIGRVSALGWASGYLGGIVLLLVLYTTLIAGEHHAFGIPETGGLNIRVVALGCAVWAAVFGLPVLLAVPEAPPLAGGPPPGIVRAYRRLIRDVVALWRSDRILVRFLIASAVFRDGLVGVFSFGGVIAATVFGFTFSQVLVFGIAANVVAGISTVVSGRFDDRFGPKAVILTSLVGLVIAGGGVFVARGGGTTAFWVGGLVLCLFVGPAQSASRSMLARMVPAERQGELFGLYATTGRAATFLAPTMFTLFIAVTGDQAFGILGIVLVLLAGLLLLIPVRAGGPPARTVPPAR